MSDASRGASPNASEDRPDAVLRLAAAYAFAAERHAHQRRKGASAEPYLNHLAEVAHLVALATAGADPDAVVAAVLHDAIEDTPTTEQEIAGRFGLAVAALVAEMTDDKSLPKEERKRRQVANAPYVSDRAKLIKLADKISNLRALATAPPLGWPQERRRAYVDWARRVAEGLRGRNAWLDATFDAAATMAEASLDAASAAPSKSAER